MCDVKITFTSVDLIKINIKHVLDTFLKHECNFYRWRKESDTNKHCLIFCSFISDIVNIALNGNKSDV